MKYKAIIFDMDGTIINTEEIWRKATRDILESRGVYLSPESMHELYAKTAGLALQYSCKLIKEVGNLPDPVELLIEEKSRRACELYAQEVSFIEGFLPFFEQAQALGLKVALATNADDQTVKITDEKLNLNKLFGTHIYNITSVNYQGKPHPAIYLHASHQLAENPAECIAIEDSAHGLKAARQAGLYCIGINTGKDESKLQESDMIINGYQDLDLKKLLKTP